MNSRMQHNFGTHPKLLKYKRSYTVVTQRYSDIAVVGAILYSLVLWRTGAFSAYYQALYLLAVLLMLIVYKLLDVYAPSGKNKLRSGSRLALAWFSVCCLLVVIGTASKQAEAYSRLVFFTWALGGLIAQVGTFFFFTYIRAHKHRIARSQIRTLIVGTGDAAQQFTRLLKMERGIEDQVIGAVSVEPLAQAENGILGEVSEINDLIKKFAIRRVYISLPFEQSEKVHSLQHALSSMNVDVFWIPDITCFQLMNHSVKEVVGTPFFALNESHVTASRVEYLLKDILDRLAALVLLILLSPVMLITAAAVKLTSSGKAIYVQERHGIDGKVIKIKKFRSMYQGSGAGQGTTAQATQGDARVTRVGRFIRRTSIDELPQLFNVLDGSMSLVGPRPHALDHNSQYEKLIQRYNLRHRTKPGITGLAQISGFRGETDTIDKMEGRVELDIHYINHWSLAMDIRILLKTPISLIVHKAH